MNCLFLSMSFSPRAAFSFFIAKFLGCVVHAVAGPYIGLAVHTIDA